MIPRRNPRFYKGELKDILSLIFEKKVGEGKYIEMFEKKFAEQIGTKFAIATCSGRNAMDLLLESLDLSKGDEILMPAYTLKDLIQVIKQRGLVPKLVDIEEDSFNIDPNAIEERITDKTKVIIATHMFGLPCNIEKISDIANKHDLVLIEDCAHAAGAKFKDKSAGSFGRAAFFSFEVTKPINTFGGGAITTGDDALYAAIKEKIKNYPIHSRKLVSKILFTYIEHLIIKSPFYRLLNLLFMFKFTTVIISKLYLFLHKQSRVEYSRFTNLQALLGLKQITSLSFCNKKRNRSAWELTDKLGDKVQLQRSEFENNRIFYFYVVKMVNQNNLESIRRRLSIKGVDVGIRGEITDNCALVTGNPEEYPVTDNTYNRALQLPIYDELRQKDIDFITNSISGITLKK